LFLTILVALECCEVYEARICIPIKSSSLKDGLDEEVGFDGTSLVNKWVASSTDDELLEFEDSLSLSYEIEDMISSMLKPLEDDLVGDGGATLSSTKASKLFEETTSADFDHSPPS